MYSLRQSSSSSSKLISSVFALFLTGLLVLLLRALVDFPLFLFFPLPSPLPESSSSSSSSSSLAFARSSLRLSTTRQTSTPTPDDNKTSIQTFCVSDSLSPGPLISEKRTFDSEGFHRLFLKKRIRAELREEEGKGTNQRSGIPPVRCPYSSTKTVRIEARADPPMHCSGGKGKGQKWVFSARVGKRRLTSTISTRSS